jgi:hypothetical protein
MKVRAEGGAIIFSEVFEGVGVETDNGLFGICQRDGGLEVIRGGETVYPPKAPEKELRIAEVFPVPAADIVAGALFDLMKYLANPKSGSVRCEDPADAVREFLRNRGVAYTYPEKVRWTTALGQGLAKAPATDILTKDDVKAAVAEVAAEPEPAGLNLDDLDLGAL